MTLFFIVYIVSLQQDLKRVITSSTYSQLGYMIFILEISHYVINIFHLMNHTYFKAILFLSVDLMRGLAPKLPLTYASMFISDFSLIRFPYVARFFSKDVILELAYTHFDGDTSWREGSRKVVRHSIMPVSLHMALNPMSGRDAPSVMVIPFIILSSH
ncbi:hypothetical protein SELMODRAFT_235694 [Selaginella moellendorffii]|uniref:NADH:quinone oxidoreductase/Mrp antiporter transmembrane domain-containing protein n=1 Tax=Selaginella moellendorffii TaxID=88036 RepID=D8T0I6_SELML|nr:hypothetical protein SELMODRAFT_235694 [Selaginella moellendorffii]